MHSSFTKWGSPHAELKEKSYALLRHFVSCSGLPCERLNSNHRSTNTTSMATRPKNADTVRLTLEILKRIPRNRAISASELHQQLSAVGIDRSRRTIERQLESLVDQFDIECDSRS